MSWKRVDKPKVTRGISNAVSGTDSWAASSLSFRSVFMRLRR